MESNSKKWKDRLLSSSLPLQYDVSRILIKQNFFIDYDYSYKRYDDDLEKEFSIDIKAGGFYPFEINSSIKINIDLLIECKYRNPNVSWLFIKDINCDNFSSFSQRGVIKVLDEFSKIHSNGFNPFPLCERCLKGMEINIQNGEVHDKDIIHGINQLIYSIPSLVYRHIDNSLTEHLEDIYPYIICPILLTTADLRILKNNFSIKKLQSSENINEISYEVPFLKLYSTPYPSLSRHCSNIFEGLPKESQNKRFKYFKKLKELEYNTNGDFNIKKMYRQPEWFLKELKLGHYDIFREVIICNLKNFNELIKEIKTGIEALEAGFETVKLKKA